MDDINNKFNSNEIITIKLKGYNNITVMYDMFCGCEALYSLSDI